MIAARATRRGVIGTLLLAGIETTDRHPGVMLAALGSVIVLAGVLEGLLP